MRLIPINDAEVHALAYRSMEAPLKALLRWAADSTAKSLLERVQAILKASGYSGWETASVLVRPAPPEAVREIERLAQSCPDAVRARVMKRLFGQIGNGTLTVRKAIRDVCEFERFVLSPKLYQEGRENLRALGSEAFLRGEYSIQRQVGVGWEVESPGIRQVDAFMKGTWSKSSVTAYLEPVGRKMRDEIEQSLMMGENPRKLADRMASVERMDLARAERSARTIVTAVSNEAHAESYRKHGVKRYEFEATFDERTCPVCGSLDGKTFALEDKAVGRNYPPMHPNCRCTTAAALSKELNERLFKEFAVHNKDGTVSVVDGRTTYEQWARENLKKKLY